MRTPNDQGEATTLKAWTETVFAAHGHDHDGSIRLDDTSRSPRTERIRKSQGGPVAIEREASIGIDNPYRFSQPRLEGYDLDHDHGVSRSELAEGIVRDAGIGGGLFRNTSDRRDRP